MGVKVVLRSVVVVDHDHHGGDDDDGALDRHLLWVSVSFRICSVRNISGDLKYSIIDGVALQCCCCC